MSFLKSAELLNEIVQEITYVILPKNWQRIIFYTERLRDSEIGLRKMDTADCWVGDKPELYNKDYCLKGSMELMEQIDLLFEEGEQDGIPWCGLLLNIENTGKFSSKFYYENTPLLDSDQDELDKRLSYFVK